ncbi:hypothetical protein MBLNU459_g2322t1 [Dothideomycetes sp. NU459]
MAHVRKRPFQPSTNQPSITSYFSRRDDNLTLTDAHQDPYDRANCPTLSPPLPDHVQSLLINVGMRVRKSVPEGYKTHKTLPPPSSAPALISYPSQAENIPPSSAPALYTKPSELTPFCGLHKIGGYASQPDTPSAIPSSAPPLSNSQSTLQSSAASMLPPSHPFRAVGIRKRSYDDEIEDELDAIFDAEDNADVPLSPKTKYPVSHSSMPALNPASSPFVRPESRPKARLKTRSTPIAPEFLRTNSDKDFDDGDVAFLQPMDCD